MAGRREHVVRSLCPAVRRGVDDPRPVEIAGCRFELFVLLVDGAEAARGELDVRPIEVADDDLGVAQAEPTADLVSDRLRRGGRQGDPHRHVRKSASALSRR